MLKNIFSNWLGLVVLGLISVVLTPAMVHGLGPLYYGMWALVGSLVDYSGMLDMGMRATLFRYVAFFRGANQRDSLNQTFATGMLIAAGTTIVTFLAFLGLGFILPSFFKFSGADKTTFSFVTILMGTSVSLAFPGQFLSAYLRGMERFDLYNVGMIVHGIVRAVTLLILLKLGYGVLALSASTVGLAVLFLAVHFLMVKWADPELQLSFKNLSWQRTKEMCNFGFDSFVNNSGETLRYYTDSFVIGRMLSVALVTPFSVATRLTEYFKMLVGGISGPIMVRLSGLSGQGNDEELKEEFLRSTRFSMLLSVFVGGILLVDGRMLISLWMGPNLLTSYPILVALTVAYIITWGQIPCPMLLFARARHHRAISWWTLGEGIANLALSILWAPKLGLLGVALGTAVPLMVSKLVIQPYYVLKDVGLSVGVYFWRGLSRALMVAVIFLSVSWYLVENYASNAGFLTLILVCFWQAGFFLLLCMSVGLAKADRTTVRAAAKDFAMSLGVARRM